MHYFDIRGLYSVCFHLFLMFMEDLERGEGGWGWGRRSIFMFLGCRMCAMAARDCCLLLDQTSGPHLLHFAFLGHMALSTEIPLRLHFNTLIINMITELIT